MVLGTPSHDFEAPSPTQNTPIRKVNLHKKEVNNK